jgi:hypothetical protein
VTGVAGEGLASEGAVGRKRQAAMWTCGERDDVWAPRPSPCAPSTSPNDRIGSAI